MTRGTWGRTSLPTRNNSIRASLRGGQSSPLLGFLGACGSGLGHDSFDFDGVPGETLAEKLRPRFGDEDVVLNAHAEILFGDVNAWLDGDDHAGLERFAVFTRVVDIQTDMVSETVNEILAERFAAQIFAVGIDVVVG